jgi:hypothetical protein
MAIDATIDPKVQILLQYADEEVLTRTIWTLSAEQKKSHIFKQLGEQRYLSSLRAGALDNAQLTRVAFSMDPFFLRSKLVENAARAGYELQISLGHTDMAGRIKNELGLAPDAPGAPSAS